MPVKPTDPIKTALDRSKTGAALLAPTQLWQFLGTRKDRPFVPFEAQAEIIDSVMIPWPGVDSNGTPYPRIHTPRCGRRFGKTTTGEVLMWHGLIAPEDDFGPPFVGMTADTEEHAMKIWRRFIWHLENTPLQALLADYSKEYQRVTLKNGAIAQLFSANNPATLAGEGATLWIIDEAQYFSRAAWENMYPSTSDRNGVIVMFGVCEGEGPFKEASYKGRQGGDPAYRDYCYPTASNPMISKYAIEEARRILPPHKFRQLYLAQWVNELGKVFRNVKGCTHTDWEVQVHDTDFGYLELPKPGHTYYGGLDLARLQDWTVYTIWDRDGKLVAFDRYNLVSWELQKKRIAALSRLYGHPLTCVDASGVGDPVPDDLARLGMAVSEYKITGSQAKRILIDELAIRVGAGQLAFPFIGVFDAELERFEAKRASDTSSVVRYEAPSGMTDDFVMSAALAMQVVPPPLAPSAPSSYDRPAREASPYESL